MDEIAKQKRAEAKERRAADRKRSDEAAAARRLREATAKGRFTARSGGQKFETFPQRVARLTAEAIAKQQKVDAKNERARLRGEAQAARARRKAHDDYLKIIPKFSG